MKTVLFVTAMMCLCPSAFALTVVEAKTKLGLDSTAPGTPATELSVQMVNDAYAKTIRALLEQVATGNPGAVAASQAAAEARIFLLRDLRGCETELNSRGDDAKDKKPPTPPVPRVRAPWLNALYPQVFPESFNPVDESQIRELMPVLVAHPYETLSSLALLEDELEPRFVGFDKNSLYYYQDILAYELRKYLREIRASQPGLLENFDHAVLAKFYELSNDTDHFGRFLHTLSSLNMPSATVQTALITSMEDPRIEIRTGAYGILKRNAESSGIPLLLEAALLANSNDRAMTVLALSKTPLSTTTYQTILKRLPQIDDAQIVREITTSLLARSDWKTPTLFALKGVRDNTRAEPLARLFAAQTLIEARVDVARSEKAMLAMLASPTPEIRFNLTSWCINRRDFCSNEVREAVESARVPQRHQAQN